jgi:hypothetical protein
MLELFMKYIHFSLLPGDCKIIFVTHGFLFVVDFRRVFFVSNVATPYILFRIHWNLAAVRQLMNGFATRNFSVMDGMMESQNIHA